MTYRSLFTEVSGEEMLRDPLGGYVVRLAGRRSCGKPQCFSTRAGQRRSPGRRAVVCAPVPPRIGWTSAQPSTHVPGSLRSFQSTDPSTHEWRIGWPDRLAGSAQRPTENSCTCSRSCGQLQLRWGLGEGRIPQLVRTMEHRGLIVTLTPFAGEATATVDAFSTSQPPRPIVVLPPDRADDVYRHRFTAADELGHLVLHGDTVPGDTQQEKEADRFAAELLTPAETITPLLPSRMDFKALDRLSLEWGVAVESLVYRCRELGTISEPAYRRAFQRLAQLRKLNLFQPEPVAKYPGEMPLLLRRAFELAEKNGLTLPLLADELKVKLPRLRLLLGTEDPRPRLRLVRTALASTALSLLRGADWHAPRRRGFA